MRVHAHRGNTLAAGAVVLAAAAVEAELRPGTSTAARTVLTVALAVISALGALRSPAEHDGPRAYQELLLAFTALATTASVAHVADLVGVSPGRPLDAWWVAGIAAVGAVLGLGLARARDGAMVFGLGAAAAVVALVVAVGAAWPGDDPRTGIRWVLLACAGLLVLSIVVRIDRRYAQAVALADVLAAVVVLLAGSFLLDDVRGASDALGLPAESASAGTGWQLLLVTAGFALAGLGATLHERGPGWFGALALVGSLGVLARDGDGLVGGFVVLAAIGLVLAGIALRPVAYVQARDEAEDGPPSPVVPFPRRRPVTDGRRTDPDDDLI